MKTSHLQDNQSQRRSWRGSWTKRQLCYFMLWVAVAFGAMFLLITRLPGKDILDASTRPIDGGLEYIVKSTWTEIIVSSALGLLLLIGLQLRLRRQTLLERFVAAVFVLIFVTLISFPPTKWNDVYRIVVQGEDVKFESLFRSSNVSRREITTVKIFRREGRKKRREYAEYGATIELEGGRLFRTASVESPLMRSRPQEDERYKKFFADLSANLKPQ